MCRSASGELSGALTLPFSSLLREVPSVQRAGSNRSSLSEPSTPAPSAASQGAQGPLGFGQKASPGGAPSLQDAAMLGGTGSIGAGGQMPMARKQLFEMFACWCEEGLGDGES